MKVNNEQQNLSAINDAWEAPAPSAEANEAQLADLRLTDEELDGIKGGTGDEPTTTIERPTGGGGFINNHNETTVKDGEAGGQVCLTDLPVADEQAEEIKGGRLTNVEYTVTVTDTQTGCVR